MMLEADQMEAVMWARGFVVGERIKHLRHARNDLKFTCGSKNNVAWDTEAEEGL